MTRQIFGTTRARWCLQGGCLAILALVGCVVVGAGPAGAAESCQALFRKEQKGTARTVLLNGGKALDLFRRYQSEAEKQHVGLSLWRTRVVLTAGKERKELSLKWFEMLTGQGAKERWTTVLRPLDADSDEAALQEAERQQWDVICAGNPSDGPAPKSAEGGGSAGPRGEAPLGAKQSLQAGMQYAARRDFENAISEFSRAIQQHPRYATAYANRGVAYMQQKKFNVALDDLKKAVELDGKDPMIHYNLTCWYSVQNQLDRGLNSLDSALGNGFKDYDALRGDPELVNLRAHPEWRRTLEKHKVFLK
jgi:tetratricopeptide (TPR) repeat protein